MSQNNFHKSNFGAFGGNLPCDLDGYVHLTAAGWLNAPMDAMGGEMAAEQAEEMAETARTATAEAEAALKEWQTQNA